MDQDTISLDRPPADATSQRLPNRAAVRALVSAHLAAKRPVAELDIAPNRPDDLHDFAFVGRTPKKTSQSDWYRCSFCQTDRKFSSGRIVLSSDNCLRLIGDECWDNHLDRNRYEEERQDWRNYERRQKFDQLRTRLSPKLTNFISLLNSVLLQENETINFIENLPRILASDAPVLLQQLQQVQRIGGQLRVDRFVRDYAAMEREGLERSTVRTEVIHTVMGLNAALPPAPQLRQEIKGALDHVLAARNRIERTDWEKISNNQAANAISSIEADVRSGVDAAKMALDVTISASAFMSSPNIAGMARWSDDTDSELMFYGRIAAIPNGFSFTTEDGKRFVLRRPQNLRATLVPDLSELKEFL